MSSLVVNVSTAASNEIIPAVSGKRIRVLGLQLIAAEEVTVTLEDSDGLNLFGPILLGASGGVVLPPVSPSPLYGTAYCEVAAGKAVHLLLNGAVQVGGAIQYVVQK
jgi:hypothetical protein